MLNMYLEHSIFEPFSRKNRNIINASGHKFLKFNLRVINYSAKNVMVVYRIKSARWF